MTSLQNTGNIFYVYTEADFEDFLQLNSTFVRKANYSFRDVVLEDVFKHKVYNVVKKLRSRRMFSPHDLIPFYAEGNFTWVFSVKGESPEQELISVALVRNDVFTPEKGEILYLDVAEPDDIAALVRLHEAASRIAKTWGKELPSLNVKEDAEKRNANFLEFIEGTGMLKPNHSGTH